LFLKKIKKKGGCRLKRKQAYNQAEKTSKTPTESLPEKEFSASYTDEDPMKGANRNSKKGKAHGT
jgi:hypothetical protein